MKLDDMLINPENVSMTPDTRSAIKVKSIPGWRVSPPASASVHREVAVYPDGTLTVSVSPATPPTDDTGTNPIETILTSPAPTRVFITE